MSHAMGCRSRSMGDELDCTCGVDEIAEAEIADSCEACNAEVGESCRPGCLGYALAMGEL